MPVRIVPKNYRSLTGLVSNTRTQSMTAFESSLERDFLQLLDFDPEVGFYEEQPLKITYADERGRRRTYTPDVFVRYRIDPLQTKLTPSLLCEIKYREDLRQHWADYRPKFRAAGRYARQQGDWIDLLIQHKREADATASGVSSSTLELVPSHHGQTASPEIPSDQAVCDPSADADQGWHATDTAAA